MANARRIVAPIDESQLVTLPQNVHPLTRTQLDRGPAPISDSTGPIQLLLRRSTMQQQALTQYLSDVQNPASPSYHKWLTPAQYGAQFGVDIADIQTVESWLESHGFRIDKVPASHNRIVFSGTMDQVQQAFHTSIHSFIFQGKTRFANVTDPQIPAALAPVIAGVGPLNNFRPQPNAAVAGGGRWDSATHSILPMLTLFSNNQPYLFVDPADAATIYDTPNGVLNPNYTAGTNYTGSGATIGIAGVSNVYMQDIQNYRTGFLGETTTGANVPTVIIDGNDPGIDTSGAGVEALLDNEVAGGLAPGAHIDFYISAGSDLSDGLLNAIARAIDDDAVDILSVSFGTCEADLGTSGNQLMLEIGQQAAAQGISLVVSAGDGGSAGCDNFDTEATAQYGLGINGFASTPYDIAVGGTDFDVLPSSFATYASSTTNGTAPYYRTASKYIPEKPWNDSTTVNTTVSSNSPLTSSGKTNIVAGGGGISSIYGKPAFQTSLTPADGQRDVPDVSLLAGNGLYAATWVVCSDTVTDGTGDTLAVPDCSNSAGQFNNSTTFEGVGGTSSAAPAFAGILALAVQATGGRLGQADTVLYQLAKSHPSYFHDITSGDNSVPCTSGSPNCGSNGFLTGYNAGSGYDLASGLGSMDAAAIVNNWESVSLGSTSTTLQIDGSSASYSGVHGADLTFSAGVTGTSGTPTGIVAVTDNADMTAGGTAAGAQNNGQIAIPLTSGSGSVTYNGLPGGTYSVTARYGGDASFASSTSTPISVSISAEPSTTTLAVNAYNSANGQTISNSNIPYGDLVFADATITGTAEGANTQGVATGTVKFLNGSTVLGTINVDSGNRTSWPPLNGNFMALPGGTYNLTAQYSGDASYDSSTSSSVPITVVPAPTTISAQSTLYDLTATDSTTIIVNVTATPNAGVPPTGSVTITSNGTTLATISSLTPSGFTPFGDATIQANQLALGENVLTVKYNGDGNYASSSTTLTIDYSGNGGFAIGSLANLAVSPGSTVYAPITLSGSGGFSGGVVFSCGFSGIPDNSLTCVIPGVSVAPTGPSSGMIIVTATSAAKAGAYTAGLIATSELNTKITETGSFMVMVSQNQTPSLAVVSNGNLSVAPGESAGTTSSVTIVPSGGLSGQLNLTCSVTTSLSSPDSPPACSVPASVEVTSRQASVVAVSVTTTAATTTGDYTFSVTATDAQTPAITGSSTAQLTVTSSPEFVLDSAGPFTFYPHATSGNTATITATPLNGYSGTVDLFCNVALLTSASGSESGSLPECAGPSSLAVGGSPKSFSVNITATGNPAYPVSGVYLATVYGYDSSNGNLTAATQIEVTVPNPALALTNSGNISVNPGATTGNASTITIAPSGGFTGTVSLTCSVSTAINNPSDLPTCSVPSSITISGTASVTATLTVSTTAPSSSRLDLPLNKFLVGGGGAVFAIVLFFGMPARRRAWRALFCLLAATIIANAIGCGGGSGSGGGGGGNPGTTPGSYQVTVTGTAASTSGTTANTVVTLTVN